MEKLKELDFEVELKKIAIADTNSIIEGKNAIVRKDNKAVLSIVSKDYRLIKHTEAMARPAETLIAEGFDVRSSYVSHYGAKAILELHSKDTIKINDDNYKTRILLINSYDATTSFRMEFGLFRLICFNGAGFNAPNKDVTSIQHIGADKLFDKDIVMEFMKSRVDYVRSYEEIVNKLANFKVDNDEEAKKIFEKLKFGKRTVNHLLAEWRRDINYKPNLYGLYNGITSLMSRKIEKPDKSGKGIGNRVMFSNWITNKTIHQLAEVVNL